MSKTRTQKAALNVMTTAILEVVTLVCGLILPRIILSHYGSAYNGITSSAKQFLSAISILNVGVAGSTRVALYKSLANHDTEKTSGIIKALELQMRKIGIVLIIYGIALTVLYPLLVDTGYGWYEVAPLIMAASLSSFGRYFFGLTYKAFLSADQRVYITNVFSIITNLLNTAINIVLIYTGCSIQIVRMVASIVLLLNPVLYRAYVKKKYNINSRCQPDNAALSMRRDVMAHSLANIVHDHTDMVILTIFTNVKIVSVYTVYNLIMSALKKTQHVFTSGTESLYGNMWAKGEYNKISENLSNYEHIVSSFISIVFSTTIIMILPFISLYTKGVHDVNYMLRSYAIVITVAQAWFCMRSPYITLVQGVGHYKQTKKGAYCEAGINIIVSIIMVNIIGITGVAIGTLVANIFRTVQYAFYIDNHLVKRGISVFIRRIIWTVANVLIISLPIGYFVSNYHIHSWLSWVLCSVIVVVISSTITVVSSLVFYRKDFNAVIKIIQRSLRKKRKIA